MTRAGSRRSKFAILSGHGRNLLTIRVKVEPAKDSGDRGHRMVLLGQKLGAQFYHLSALAMVTLRPKWGTQWHGAYRAGGADGRRPR